MNFLPSYIISWTSNIQWDDDVRFVLDQQANSLKRQFADRLTHYPDSEPTSLFSYSVKIRVYRKSNKYQFYSLWFDPTGFELTIYRTRIEHINNYTTDAVDNVMWVPNTIICAPKYSDSMMLHYSNAVGTFLFGVAMKYSLKTLNAENKYMVHSYTAHTVVMI
jgi:hypothetical protein